MYTSTATEAAVSALHHSPEMADAKNQVKIIR